ncbi:MAG: polysaccharide deacetylase family protein, partial [Rhodospirillales bacterium]|nr:polysaccharide deacetylase family protein [Rhodospirillales bacterium]
MLEFLDSLAVKGTVFSVGHVARDHPALIRSIAENGHELACHGLVHRPLDRETEASFVADTADAKAMIEDVAGVQVHGYRAPIFSLTPRTPWAADAIRNLGFRYSSSVMPAANPLYGHSLAPQRPFFWPNGLVELPCPVARMGVLSFPFLGGIYLRYLPSVALRWLLRRHEGTGLWTYCHPYDFDSEEGFVRFDGVGLVASLLLSANRARTFDRIKRVLAFGVAPPLADRV